MQDEPPIGHMRILENPVESPGVEAAGTAESSFAPEADVGWGTGYRARGLVRLSPRQYSPCNQNRY